MPRNPQPEPPTSSLGAADVAALRQAQGTFEAGYRAGVQYRREAEAEGVTALDPEYLRLLAAHLAAQLVDDRPIAQQTYAAGFLAAAFAADPWMLTAESQALPVTAEALNADRFLDRLVI